jgi:hypothetical protein
LTPDKEEIGSDSKDIAENESLALEGEPRNTALKQASATNFEGGTAQLHQTAVPTRK